MRLRFENVLYHADVLNPICLLLFARTVFFARTVLPLNVLHKILLGCSYEYLTSFVIDFASYHMSDATHIFSISSSNVCVATVTISKLIAS